MPETGLSRSPKVQRGAMVQLVESIPFVVTPNIVPFQYNPSHPSHPFLKSFFCTYEMLPFSPLLHRAI